MSEKNLHNTAIVDADARIGADVEVGPRAVIEGGVRIGDRCRIGAGVVIKSGTTLGEDNVIREYAVLGGDPQHQQYQGAPTSLRIGSGNMIGEFVTFHRAFEEGGETVVGDGNYFMTCSHVGHDCRVGNQCVLTNYASLGGHSVIEDRVIFSGYAAVHQFVRVGTMAMLAGGTLVAKDVVPYMTYLGVPGVPVSVNLVGLKRNGVSEQARTQVRRVFRILFKSGLSVPEALKKIREEVELSDEVRHILEFVEESRRGIAM